MVVWFSMAVSDSPSPFRQTSTPQLLCFRVVQYQQRKDFITGKRLIQVGGTLPLDSLKDQNQQYFHYISLGKTASYFKLQVI